MELQTPTIPVSRNVQVLTSGYNGWEFSADVAANILAEHESQKRALMAAYYREKAARVGLSLETYCRRFNVRGVV